MAAEGRVRVGVVGLGVMGGRHLRAAQASDRVEVVGVADSSQADHSHDVDVRVSPSLDHLLAVGIDACIVATPSPDHLSSALRLAEAGVHVLVEKPLAMRVDDCRRIVAAFEGSGLVARVAHVERFNRSLIALRERVRGGAVGDVTEITTRRVSGPPRRRDGGGVLLDLGTHDFDLTAWLLGHPIEVERCCAVPIGGAPISDAVDVQLDLVGGPVGRYVLSWVGSERVRTVTVRGAAGTLSADALAGSGSASPHDSPDPLTAQLCAWLDVIAGRLDPVAPEAGASLDDGLRAVAIAELARASTCRP